MFTRFLGDRSRCVAIRMLSRQLDVVIVDLENFAPSTTHATFAGRGETRDVARLARWTGARTPLRLVPDGVGVLLVDASGSRVHLDVDSADGRRARSSSAA